MKRLSVLILLFGAALHLFAQSRQQIEKLYDYERYNEAKSVVLGWIAKDSKSAEALYTAGKLYSKLGLVDSAENFFKLGIEVDRKFAYNYIGLVRIAYHRDKAYQVQKYIEDAKDNASPSPRKDARFWVELEDACLLAPAENNPIETYAAEAVKIDRKNANIYMILGEYYTKHNNATAASENFQKAIDYDKTRCAAYTGRGLIYERVKNYMSAEEQYNNARNADSLYPGTYFRLAEMYHDQKSYDKAVVNFRQYIKLSEPSLAVMRQYANYLFQAKEYKSAIDILLNLKKSNPTDPYFSRLLAYSYFETDDSVNAVASFAEYFKLIEPDKTTYGDFSRFGRLQAKLGNDSLALVNLKKAFELDTTKYEMLGDQAKIYKKQKRWKELGSVLSRKMARGGKDVEITDYIDLGIALYFDSSYVKAKETFEKLATLRPKLLISYLWLSRINVALDPESKDWRAKSAYEKFIELATDAAKYKKDLIVANAYLASYYFTQYDSLKTTDAATAQTSLLKSFELWNKVLELDPENAQAKDVVKAKEFKDLKK